MRFTDDSVVDADVVIYCTGYKITFPFFDEGFISAPDNHIELFRRVFHPDIANIFFIGLLQPLGAIMPLAEAQGAWVGDYLLGDYALPPAAAGAGGHRRGSGEHAQALRGLQAPHDPGRLRRLPPRPREGARAGTRPRTRERLSPTGAVPEFCRHNRFLDRCPICSRTLGDRAPRERAAGGATRARARAPKAASAHPRSTRGESVRIQRQERSADDGYRSELVPGLHASADADRLVEEIAFASGRLLLLGSEPPDLYAEARSLAERDPEQASWICFLIAYLCPLEGADPFAGIREALGTDRQDLQDLGDRARPSQLS